MLYTPNTDKLWDCWIVPHNDKYYLFYLTLSNCASSWDGISLAVSDDLLHWEEYGQILEKDADSEWIGTGMVQKINGKFIMNFSQERPKGVQRIYFAESADLIHWTKLPDICEPDGINYLKYPEDTTGCNVRWDSLGIDRALDENAEPPYFGFLTSSAAKPKNLAKSGTLGLLTSNDGLKWECLPNAFPDTDAFPFFEVPEHISFGDRHYVLFCSSSYLGFRFDNMSEFMSGGTYYVTSDNLTGPYRLPDGDIMLQGTRDNTSVSMVSVGRPIKINGQVMYYHIWGENCGSGWFGTLKLLEEIRPYQLRLKYNPINDALYGKKLTDDNFYGKLTLIRNAGKIAPMDFEINKSIKFINLGISAGLIHDNLKGNEFKIVSDYSDGRIIDADIEIKNGIGCGFFFKTASSKNAAVLFNYKKQRLEFGNIHDGWGANLVFSGELYQKFEIIHKFHCKILVRKEFFEVYINDIYVSSWRTRDYIKPNDFGLYFEDADGFIENLKVYEMM